MFFLCVDNSANNKGPDNGQFLDKTLMNEFLLKDIDPETRNKIFNILGILKLKKHAFLKYKSYKISLPRTREALLEIKKSADLGNLFICLKSDKNLRFQNIGLLFNKFLVFNNQELDQIFQALQTVP